MKRFVHGTMASLALLACGKSSSSAQLAPEVDVRPAAVTLAPGRQQAFEAAVTNAADTAVSWSVVEGAPGGTVTSAGLYTAPASAGVFHVAATSVFDPT